MTNSLMFVLLQQPTGGNQMVPMLIMMVLIIVVFYFFMIRPNMKRQKELKKFREGLKNGDKVITSGGIYGKIVEVREDAVIIEVEDKARLKVHKEHVVASPTDIQQKQ